ncbi:GNAT family N-acetyltransferase [Bacteroidota bacterium]
MKKITVILTAIIIIVLQQLLLSQDKPFIPVDFNVPDTLENDYFRIRMLTINDVVKDYDAVMSSIDHLNKQFPHWGWPTKDLTLEQDLIDLGWHQKEFQIRSSFTYTVVTLDESQVIGCIYIFPAQKGDFDAQINMWVRSSVLDMGYDSILYNTVRQWIKTDWPFDKVAYPIREIILDEWNSLK